MTCHTLSLSIYARAPMGALRPVHPHNEQYNCKPGGLWFSVDGERDWLSWCMAEGRFLEDLAFRHVVTIKNDARILHIANEIDLLSFGSSQGSDSWEGPGIDWRPTKQLYDGIIIAPYLWHAQLADRVPWYDCWDCASGCIWNVEAIECVTLDKCWASPASNRTADAPPYA